MTFSSRPRLMCLVLISLLRQCPPSLIIIYKLSLKLLCMWECVWFPLNPKVWGSEHGESNLMCFIMTSETELEHDPLALSFKRATRGHQTDSEVIVGDGGGESRQHQYFPVLKFVPTIQTHTHIQPTVNEMKNLQFRDKLGRKDYIGTGQSVVVLQSKCLSVPSSAWPHCLEDMFAYPSVFCVSHSASLIY